MLEEWIILLGIKLCFYANPSFCFIMQIWFLVTWANTFYNRFLTVQEMRVRTCPFLLGANSHVDFLHFMRRCNLSNLIVRQCFSKNKLINIFIFPSLFDQPCFSFIYNPYNQPFFIVKKRNVVLFTMFSRSLSYGAIEFLPITFKFRREPVPLPTGYVIRSRNNGLYHMNEALLSWLKS